MCAPAPAATKGRGYRPRRRRKADPFVGPDRKQWAECRRCLLLRVSITPLTVDRAQIDPLRRGGDEGQLVSEPLGDRKSESSSSPLATRWTKTDSRAQPLAELGKEAQVYIYIYIYIYGPFALKLYKSSARKGSPFREAAILATIEFSWIAYTDCSPSAEGGKIYPLGGSHVAGRGSFFWRKKWRFSQDRCQSG